MKISLLHPSRGRALKAANAAMNWLDKADASPEYILSLDDNDPQLSQYQTMFPKENILISNNRSLVDACNRAAEKSTGDLLVVMSDDFDCPQGWDTLLEEALQGKEDYIVKVNDTMQEWLITLPIMDRNYYERFNYIYNPNYFHLFADTEMTAVGHLLGRIITLPLIFEHQHWVNNKAEKDATYVRSEKSWNIGERTYLNNARKNFGIKSDMKLPTEHVEWLKGKGLQF